MEREIPRIASERLILTLPPPEHAEHVAAFFQRNDEIIIPSSPKQGNFNEHSFWQNRLKQNREEFLQDKSARFFILEKKDESKVIGFCNFTCFLRGPFQCCTLGFSLCHEKQGNTYLTEALKTCFGYIFEELKFHRIQANYLPKNERSRRLLRKLGFEVNGYACDYLYIDGDWRDHILASLTNPNSAAPAL